MQDPAQATAFLHAVSPPPFLFLGTHFMFLSQWALFLFKAQ